MWAVDNERVTREHRADVEEFQRLQGLKSEGRLRTPGRKRMLRIQTRLQKFKIIRRITHEDLRAAAQRKYDSMWFWERWRLRLAFYRKQFRLWREKKAAEWALRRLK